MKSPRVEIDKLNVEAQIPHLKQRLEFMNKNKSRKGTRIFTKKRKAKLNKTRNSWKEALKVDKVNKKFAGKITQKTKRRRTWVFYELKIKELNYWW